MKKKKNKETKKKGRGTKDGKYLFMDKNIHRKKKRTRDSTTTTISIIRRHSLLPLSRKYEYRSNQQLSKYRGSFFARVHYQFYQRER